MFHDCNRFAVMTLILTLAGLAACGDDPSEPEPPAPTVLRVEVHDQVDDAAIANSNVVLFRAETKEAVDRGMTDENGSIEFQPQSGNYYLNVSAQGFRPVPQELITPIPFFVTAEDTTRQSMSLPPLDTVGDAGYIWGQIEPTIDNFLVLIESNTTSERYSTISGPDGVFVAFNLPFDDYSVDALKAGYRTDGALDAALSAVAPVDTVRFAVADYAGSQLSGSVTFLASENSTVDITLLDPRTRSVVPGLAVMNEPSNLDYALQAIPDGEYLAWASFRNDGYVLDPDWLFKNPGGLDIAFASAGSAQLNFSVTGAITLVSPTNPADTTYPAQASSLTPTFQWQAYPSTKEYFIEVRDLNGNVLWGGFGSDGTAHHAFIGANVLSVQYNFDGQDVAALEPDTIYQWQLWADKGTAADSFVEQLISSSEDLRGIFRTPASPAVE